MKKLVLMFVVALLSSAAFAQESLVKKMEAVKISKSDLPSPVITASPTVVGGINSERNKSSRPRSPSNIELYEMHSSGY